VVEAALVYDAELSPDTQWYVELPEKRSSVLSSSEKELRIGNVPLPRTSKISLRILKEWV